MMKRFISILLLLAFARICPAPSVQFDGVHTLTAPVSGLVVPTSLTAVQPDTNTPSLFINNSGSKTYGIGNGWWGAASINVAYFIPNSGSDLCILDLIPTANADSWIDICNADGRSTGFTGAGSGQWLHVMMKKEGYGVVSATRNVSPGTNSPLYLQSYTGAGRLAVGQGFGTSDYPLLYTQIRPTSGINFGIDTKNSGLWLAAFNDAGSGRIPLRFDASTRFWDFDGSGTKWSSAVDQWRVATDQSLSISTTTIGGYAGLKLATINDAASLAPPLAIQAGYMELQDGVGHSVVVITNNNITTSATLNNFGGATVINPAASVYEAFLNDSGALATRAQTSTAGSGATRIKRHDSASRYSFSFDDTAADAVFFQVRPATDVIMSFDNQTINSTAFARLAGLNDSSSAIPFNYQAKAHNFTTDSGTSYVLQMTNNTVGIGGTASANTVFSVTSTTLASFPAPSMNNTQKKALTQANGSIIFNSSLGTHQMSDGAHWYDLSGRRSIKTATTTYAMAADGSDDYGTIFADSTGGAFTITLPAASSYAGRVITVKDSGGAALTQNITIKSAGGNIDGTAAATGVVMVTAYKSLAFQSNGTQWFIIGSF